MIEQLLAQLERLLRKDSSQSKWSFYLGLSILAGLAGVLFRSGQSSKHSLEAMGAGFALSGASLFAGLLVGFLFAIPKSSRTSSDDLTAAKEPRRRESSYILNSNLEDISDWLTKMLVGVGLIQLKEIPGYINTTSVYWSQSVGYNFQPGYVSAVIIFFFVSGFLVGYLWTRLALIQDFIDQDPRRLIEGLGRIARSSVAPVELRAEATRQIAELVKSPASGLAERTAASEELLTISNTAGPVGIRSIAREGLEIVSRYEGDIVEPCTYPVPVDVNTIGIGHVLTSEERATGIIRINGRDIDLRVGLAKQDAIDLLEQDLEPIRQAVDEIVAVPINDNQREALVSFAFNVGVDALRTSSLLQELNKQNYDAVPDELMKWCKVDGAEIPGLVSRRKEEVDLWRKSP